MSDNAMIWGGSASSDDRLWGVLAHLSTFLVIPILWPLLIYAIGKGKPFVRYHAMQAIAIQVGLWLAGAAVSLLAAITCGIGGLLYIPLAVAALLPLYGAFRAFSGEWGGYPMLEAIGKE